MLWSEAIEAQKQPNLFYLSYQKGIFSKRFLDMNFTWFIAKKKPFLRFNGGWVKQPPFSSIVNFQTLWQFSGEWFHEPPKLPWWCLKSIQFFEFNFHTWFASCCCFTMRQSWVPWVRRLLVKVERWRQVW